MMRVFITLTFFVISYFIYGFYISQNEIRITPSGHRLVNPPTYYDYRGVTNVRTDLSNGSSSPLEVINDANTVGLDYLMLTDINSIKTNNQIDGYHNGLLVFNEGEYSFLDSRLIFVSSQNSKLPTDPSLTNVFFTDLLSQNGADNHDSLLVLAHPFNPKAAWIGPYPTGLDGIEILNPRAISQSAWLSSKLSTFWSLLIYPFNPQYAFLRLFQEPRKETALWDQLNVDQTLAGYSGIDAAARAIPFSNYLIKFPSYQKSMEIMSNHVLLKTELTGHSTKYRQKILVALKNRNFYFSLDILGDPKGFFASVKDRDQIHPMGKKLKFNRGMKLVVHLPFRPTSYFEIVVFKNGGRYAASNDEQLTTDIKGPGVYRVVVRVSASFPFPEGKRWLSWIYSNPFFITP